MSIPKITDYELQEKLGSGTYATVYKARHKVINSTTYNTVLFH